MLQYHSAIHEIMTLLIFDIVISYCKFSVRNENKQQTNLNKHLWYT